MSLQDNSLVVDYDIDNLLQSTAGNHAICEAKNEKLRKNIAFVKERIIQVHELFKYADKCTKGITEKDIELQQTRSECIQALKKISVLEKENESLHQEKIKYCMEKEFLFKNTSLNTVENEGLKATIKQYKDLVEDNDNRRILLEKEIESLRVSISEKDKSITSLKNALKKSTKRKNVKVENSNEANNKTSLDIYKLLKCTKCDDVVYQNCSPSKENSLRSKSNDSAPKDEENVFPEKIKTLEKEFSSFKTLNSSMLTFIRSLMELKLGTVKSVALKCEKYLNGLHKQYGPNMLDQEDVPNLQQNWNENVKDTCATTLDCSDNFMSEDESIDSGLNSPMYTNQKSPPMDKVFSPIPEYNDITMSELALPHIDLVNISPKKPSKRNTRNSRRSMCLSPIKEMDLPNNSSDNTVSLTYIKPTNARRSSRFTRNSELNVSPVKELAENQDLITDVLRPITRSDSKRKSRIDFKNIKLSPIKELNIFTKNEASTFVNVAVSPIRELNYNHYQSSDVALSPVRELNLQNKEVFYRDVALSPIKETISKPKRKINKRDVALSPIKVMGSCNLHENDQPDVRNVALSPIKDLNINKQKSSNHLKFAQVEIMHKIISNNNNKLQNYNEDYTSNNINSNYTSPKTKDISNNIECEHTSPKTKDYISVKITSENTFLKTKDCNTSPKTKDCISGKITSENSFPKTKDCNTSPKTKDCISGKITSEHTFPKTKDCISENIIYDHTYPKTKDYILKNISSPKSNDFSQNTSCTTTEQNIISKNTSLKTKDCILDETTSKHTSPKTKIFKNTLVQLDAKITANKMATLFDSDISPVKIGVTEKIEYRSINIKNILEDMRLFRVLSPIPSSESNEDTEEKNVDVKNAKRKKLTKLQKIRNACIIKPKIKSAALLNKKQLKQKLISSVEIVDSTPTTKKKDDVYQEAAKIAAIERKKENDKLLKKRITRAAINKEKSIEGSPTDSSEDAISTRLRSSRSESNVTIEPQSPLLPIPLQSPLSPIPSQPPLSPIPSQSPLSPIPSQSPLSPIPVFKSSLSIQNKRKLSHVETIDGKVLCVLLSTVSPEKNNELILSNKKSNKKVNESNIKTDNENNISPRITRRAKRKLSLTEKDVVIEVLSDNIDKDLPETKLKNITKNPKRSRISNISTLEPKDSDTNTSPNISSEVIKDKNKQTNDSNVITYSDLDLFCDKDTTTNNKYNENDNVNVTKISTNEEGIFLKMLNKYGQKCNNKVNTDKISKTDELALQISNELEIDIEHIVELKRTRQLTNAMSALQKKMIAHNLNAFLLGTIKFVMSEKRRDEVLCNKYTPPAPAMTKQEQVLVYILDGFNETAIEKLLNGIEYTVFRLGHTPDVGQVERLARLFAVQCKRMRKNRRLRLFMLDAMYCISYKAVPLIRQCLDVWMNVLPLAHMSTANDPLVLCLVYLLFYFKCNDYQNNVNHLRKTLIRDYGYDFKNWSQNKILEHYRNSILELRNRPLDTKTLRMCLILLGKRNGTSWCEKHIVNAMVMPLMEDPKVPAHVNQFCAGIVGVLLRPFPSSMNIQVQLILNRLEHGLFNCTPEMEQALIRSIACLHKNLPKPVLKILCEWKPRTKLSTSLELYLKDVIREKPVFIWSQLMSTM